MKLAPWTILLIGIAVFLVAITYGLFQHYIPNSTETRYYNEYAEALQVEADKMPAAKKRLDNAVKLVQQSGMEWQEVVERKTPPRNLRQGGIDLAVNRWQLTVDAPKFRDSIQRAVNAQLKRGGVEVLTGPTVPAFSTSAKDIVETGFNYPAIKFPVAIYDFGQIQVRGTLAQIFANYQAWASMPNYIAVVDGLAINGTSPKLVGTYNLTVVAYIRAPKPSGPVPEGGGGDANGGGGGGGGGAAPGGGPRGSVGTFGQPGFSRKGGAVGAG